MNQDKLKATIKEIGLSQTFVADRLGVSKTALSLWLNNVSKIPQNRLDEINNLIEEIDNKYSLIRIARNIKKIDN